MNNQIIETIKSSGAKLLIADDERIIRESLKKMGEMLGFDVYTAEDGADALELYKLHMPDFVVLDIYMPKMNGIMVMERINDINSDTKIILITGYSHYKQLLTKDRIRPNGFITKPFSMEKIVRELLKQVQEVGIFA